MTHERFKELEDRNKNDSMQLCYELFCEEKSIIPLQIFSEWFPVFIQFTKGGDINSAIEYFKNNRVK